ncbi:nucleotidyltransferase family protein [Meiothermus cerbereus]|uniref:nucleotidyltransferase family protein n=1 Tax=Meiothermus cerbereus TaxID=65552 RepID=UPI003EEB3AFC
MPPVDAIVLAAGMASRFGVPKFLLPAGEGHVLLTRVLEQALLAVEGCVAVVLGRESKVARYALERWLETAGRAGSRVVLVLNRHYRHGQSTSLKAGIRALTSSSGVLVFLADMPVLELEKLELLQKAILRPGSQALAVAAGRQGQAHPPVYLSAKLFSEIDRLKGDQGARAILRAYQGQLEVVEWGEGPWFADVDDWSTYRQLAYQQGWINEPFAPIPRRPVATAQVAARVAVALAAKAVPWLAPGVLILPAKKETHWLDLSRPYRGVQSIVQGPSSTPAAYLELLCRASLMALSR